MFELIVFDFDDTIVHLDVRWAAVKKEVLLLARKEGIQVDSGQHLVLISNVVSGNKKTKAAVDAIYEKYEAECAEAKAYHVFSGMPELLRDLKAKGYLLAIASGNHTSSIRRVLSQLSLMHFFDILCGRDLVERNKPAPDQLLYILEKTKTEKQKALFIGDSPFDEQVARAAGVSYFRITKGPDKQKDIEKLRSMLL